MAYTKTTWTDGDIVTSEKLNHMEDGIAGAGGVMVINADTNGTLDKTWQQIFDAMNTGKVCVIKETSEMFVGMDLVVSAFEEDGSYTIRSLQRISYNASSADGYPSEA